MKKYIERCYLLAMFIGCSGIVLPHAQGRKPTSDSVNDSLVTVLHQQLRLTKQDTARIVLINKLIIRFRQIDKLDSALSYLQLGLRIAQKTNHPLNLGRIYYEWGGYYDQLTLTSEAINSYTKAIPLLQQSGKVSEATVAMYALARTYTGAGMVIKAVDQVTRNLAYANQTGDYTRVGAAYSLLYEIHAGQGDQKSMYNDVMGMLAAAREHHYPLDYFLAYGNFGEWYEAHQDYVRALPYWKKALQMANQFPQLVYRTNMDCCIANNLIKQKRFNEAEFFLMRAFELSKKDKRISLNHPRRLLARLRERQNRLNEAYQLAQLGIKNDYQKHPITYLENLEILLDIQRKKGNYKQALSTFGELKTVSDSLREVNKLRIISSIDSQLALEKQIKNNVVLKKNTAIQALEIERKRQQQAIYVITTISLIVLILLLSWFYWQTQLNLTKLNQQKAEITSQAERLTELNKLKDKLFLLIGHDLRGPVINLKTSLTRLQMSRLIPDQFDQQAERLNRTVDSLYTTLDNLLEWSGLQREGLVTKPEWVDLSALVAEVMELLEPAVLQKQIVVAIDPSRIVARTDEHQARIVIRNILHNSIKFTPLGGRIQVSYEHSVQEVLVRISDTGIGMAITDPKQAAQVLRRRGTLGETGTGLGLMVCEEFMKRNGGRLKIDSALGEGTNVTLFFSATDS